MLWCSDEGKLTWWSKITVAIILYYTDATVFYLFLVVLFFLCGRCSIEQRIKLIWKLIKLWWIKDIYCRSFSQEIYVNGLPNPVASEGGGAGGGGLEPPTKDFLATGLRLPGGNRFVNAVCAWLTPLRALDTNEFVVALGKRLRSLKLFV